MLLCIEHSKLRNLLNEAETPLLLGDRCGKIQRAPYLHSLLWKHRVLNLNSHNYFKTIVTYRSVHVSFTYLECSYWEYSSFKVLKVTMQFSFIDFSCAAISRVCRTRRGKWRQKKVRNKRWRPSPPSPWWKYTFR